MSTIRTHDEFLHGDDSDDDSGSGYDSEAEPGRGAIASKRRRIDPDSDSEASFDGVDENDNENEERERPELRVLAPKDSRSGPSHPDTGTPPRDGDGQEDAPEDDDDQDDDDDKDDDDDDGLPPAAPPKSTARRQAEAAAQKTRKSGVLYISRVPPFMKPAAVRHLLAPHAPKGLGRIFLTPEHRAQHSARVQRGGNKKKSFVDGWVEFTSKRDARRAADALNGHIVGGRKGGYYHDDLWNVKYLRGFKWEHLTEQLRTENAERAARLKRAVWETRRENQRFLRHVERAKMEQTRQRKERSRRATDEPAAAAAAAHRASPPPPHRRDAPRAEFKQKPPAPAARHTDREPVAPFNGSARIAKKIF